MKYDAVFFISFGGPEKSEDIFPFLETVTRGRNIPRHRLEEVAIHYEHMGGKSPINEITRQQAQALQDALSKTDTPYPVYIGQRNWHPFIEDTLRKMVANGVKRAIGFCTAAHRSEASLERYIHAVEKARETIGPSAPVIDFVGPWFDHSLFIEAIYGKICETEEKGGHGDAETISLSPKSGLSPYFSLSPSPRVFVSPFLNIPWLFTAHSIPCSMAKESTYVDELRQTAELVVEKWSMSSPNASIGDPNQSVGPRLKPRGRQVEWELAYTSRSGNPKDPWLEPDVCTVLREKSKAGIKEALAIPIGFVADHVEVLFDLDVEAKEVADEVGITLHRAQTVGTHSLFIQMMVDVIRNHVPNDQKLATSSHIIHPQPFCYCFPDRMDAPCLKKNSQS